MRSIHAKLSAVVLGAALSSLGCENEAPTPIPSAGSKEPRHGGVITFATFGDVRSLDPANISDGLAPQILEATLAGLVDYDRDGKIVPDLAERWTVEDEGRTYRFYLRQGVRFHDGEEVTADDVKRSAERALHPSTPNPNASYFEHIVGYKDYAAKKTEHLEGVVVEGRYVVTFHIEAPDATFLPVLALPVLRPLCKNAGDRYSDAWQPCGAGPFKLPPGGWQQGMQIALTRNETYFRPGLPYLDGFTLVLRMNFTTQGYRFARGTLDVRRDFLAPEILRFQADSRWTPFAGFDAATTVNGESMNTEMPPFDNIEVRRAVACAIDREELRLLRASNLTAADQLVPPAVFGHDDSLPGQRYDYAAALEHMKRAGYAYDPVTKTGGYPHVVTYLAYNQGMSEFVAQVLAQQLAKIGIVIEVRRVNYATFIALRSRRHTSAMGPSFWTQDFPDALSFFLPLFHSSAINDENSGNSSFYSSPRFDEVVDRAKTELDAKKRKKYYDEAQKILIDDAPWAFSFYYRWYVQWQPYVRDYRAHPVWTNEVSRTWLDRTTGPVAARAMLPDDGRFWSERALASLFGARR